MLFLSRRETTAFDQRYFRGRLNTNNGWQQVLRLKHRGVFRRFSCPFAAVWTMLPRQCRSKGNISGGARKCWRREPLGGSRGMLPQKNLKSRDLERYFQRSPRAICDLRISRIIYFVHGLSKSMRIESITLATSSTNRKPTISVSWNQQMFHLSDHYSKFVVIKLSELP